MKYDIQQQLHPDTADLTNRFHVALRAKLYIAQCKYDYQNEWTAKDWEEHCRAELMRHIEKGDPLDVAAYCAFMWHHGWKTK